MIDVQGIRKLYVVILRWMLIDEIDFLIYKERVKQYLEKKKSKKIFSIKRIHDGGGGGKKRSERERDKMCEQKKKPIIPIYTTFYISVCSVCVKWQNQPTNCSALLVCLREINFLVASNQLIN